MKVAEKIKRGESLEEIGMLGLPLDYSFDAAVREPRMAPEVLRSFPSSPVPSFVHPTFSFLCALFRLVCARASCGNAQAAMSLSTPTARTVGIEFKPTTDTLGKRT